jgi:hypothetical protein
MSERDDRNLTPEEERQLGDSLRALGEVRADEAFRARLRGQFVAGTIPESESTGGPVASDAVVPPIRALPRRRSLPRPWAMAALPAIAAALVLIFLGGGEPHWRVLDVRGDGDVTVAGRAVSAADRGAVASAMDSGVRVTLPEGVELDLALGDVMVLGAAAATDFELPRAPSGSPVRYEVRVHRGDLMFKSGPDFPGREMMLSTTEGRIEITGTTVAVYKDDEVTCVCVLEGTARIGRDDSHMEPIPAGMRKVMFADGREPLIIPIEPGHRDGLLRFESRNEKTFK